MQSAAWIGGTGERLSLFGSSRRLFHQEGDKSQAEDKRDKRDCAEGHEFRGKGEKPLAREESTARGQDKSGQESEESSSSVRIIGQEPGSRVRVVFLAQKQLAIVLLVSAETARHTGKRSDGA